VAFSVVVTGAELQGMAVSEAAISMARVKGGVFFIGWLVGGLEIRQNMA
jgi:hypothetical protein